MVQDQLVDYISSQLKLGISRDAIKAALVGAGWVSTDVDDTFKKVEGGATAVQAQPVKSFTASPVSVSSASPSSLSSFAKKPERVAEPQTIRVSDLVSASSASASAAPGITSSQPKIGKTSFIANTPAKNPSMMMGMTEKKSGKGFAMTIVWIILVVIFAGAAGYFYFVNRMLSSQVGTVNTQGTDVTSQLATLQSQIQALTATDTALVAQQASLSAQNQNLQTNLSFLAVPPGAGSSSSSTPVMITGLITGGKPNYVLTTSYGVNVLVKNSANAGVRTALQPFVGSSTLVEMGGTYMPGSANMTVTSVNGVSTTAVATTTTVSSTPPLPSNSATSTP